MDTTNKNKQSLAKPQSEFDKFVYVVSHDLQEPLRGVSAFLKLLDQKYSDQLDDQAKTYINFTLENADKMRTMILALVDYSRVARNAEEKEMIALDELASEVWSMYAGEAAQKDASFSTEELPQIEGVSSQVIQLLQILFQNALDNKGDKPLEIRLTATEKDDVYEFHFSDTGRGIPEAHLESVFQIFHKVDPRSQRAGAGLAIARAIVEKYGGKIYAKSDAEVGTTMYFTWPKPR